MDIIEGIPVSPGVVIGRVFVLDDEHHRIPRREVPRVTIKAELARLEEALRASSEELTDVRDEAEREMGAEAAKIFSFHIGVLADPTLVEPMRKRISEESVTAEFAVYRTFADLAERFAGMGDSAFTTKVNDITDLATRVLRHLIGQHASRLDDLDDEAVVVAEDLTPSQTAGFDRSKVVAMATDLGGRTSHTAIVARALGIPAVVGLRGVTRAALDGQPIIIDGDRGLVILDPADEKIEEYTAYIEQRKVRQLSLDELASLESVTRDGQRITILGNIEFADEIPAILRAGGLGVGLYRTEFLYLTRRVEPTEEDHFEAYKKCVELLEGRPLVLRTVDLGADKHTQESIAIPERNPFLGCRSIRFCLKSLPMFKRQLRAMLRASAHGPISIMFPLISSSDEFRRARLVVHDVMEDLADEGIEFDRKVPIGMMVEVPSAAIMAGSLAREADFFSIGTNDLVQYTLAVDRTNERVADLFNPAHPAVIRLIREVVKSARRHDTPVSCCGESAGEPEYAMLLIGLGVRTLSVTASSMPQLKRLVRSVTINQCERIAKRALSFDSDVEVSAFLRDQARKIIPEASGGRAAGH
jgi:phosphotransferase system enzyme I (PtsI)